MQSLASRYDKSIGMSGLLLRSLCNTPRPANAGHPSHRGELSIWGNKKRARVAGSPRVLLFKILENLRLYFNRINIAAFRCDECQYPVLNIHICICGVIIAHFFIIHIQRVIIKIRIFFYGVTRKVINLSV